MKRICTICARGGSKGVFGKNLKLILGKPLIAHTIMQAKNSGVFDFIAVSSDSKEILKIAEELGVITIERPLELATDISAKLPAIKHCAIKAEEKLGIKFDTFIDLDCTSPLRNLDDIKNVVDMVENTDCQNVITGMNSRRSPYFNLVEETANGYVKLSKKLDRAIVRRQDAPKCYDMNASIYAWKREMFFSLDKVLNENTKIYEMPEERSIDIDSELDFEIVKMIMEKKLWT